MVVGEVLRKGHVGHLPGAVILDHKVPPDIGDVSAIHLGHCVVHLGVVGQFHRQRLDLLGVDLAGVDEGYLLRPLGGGSVTA